MKISTIIITLNEEEHVDRCLESIRGLADEVVVVDCGSQDKTCEVVVSLGARLFRRAWTNYSDQKNFAAAQASHDWILSLDADECLSPSLRQELLRVKANPSEPIAYEFPRRALYLGRWIRHCGWYPDYKVRLYRRERGRWEGSFVHEHLTCEGLVGRLQSELLHYTCDSISEHACRVERYTTLAAQDLRSRGKRTGPLRIFGSPIVAFFASYFLKSGFLDGLHGFLISVFSAYYNFLKYSKLWDLQRSMFAGKSSIGERSPRLGRVSKELKDKN